MKLKNLTWLIVLCLGMLLVGCGDDDSGSNNPVGGNGGNGGGGSQNTASIVGNWIFESMRVSLQTLRPASDEDRDIYVFSSNNSVTNYYYEYDIDEETGKSYNFELIKNVGTFSVNGNMLTVSYDGDAETAEFSISNDELMITGPEGEIYVYKRYTGQIPPPEPAK